MIGTLPSDANPRSALRERLAHLLTVDIPRLEAEADAESEIAAVRLEHVKQEMHDIVRLLGALDAHRSKPSYDSSFVEVNDCVTIRAHRSRRRQAMVLHGHDLTIRAQGFISVQSPLGAAVVGRRVGEAVQVRAPGDSPRIVIEGVRRT
jgi:transcription elongation GreA/GreB family factor